MCEGVVACMTLLQVVLVTTLPGRYALPAIGVTDRDIYVGMVVFYKKPWSHVNN
jgi:hypothetical protein